MVKLREESGPSRVKAPLSEQALEDVQFVRAAVERHTRVTTISPGGLLVAGLAGAASATITAMVDTSKLVASWAPPGLNIFTALWGVALFVAVAANLIGMRVRSHKQGVKFRSTAFRAMLRSMSAPLIAGGLFSVWALWNAPQPWVFAVAWIAFYGLSLIAASQHTIGVIGILGWCALLTAPLVLLFGNVLLVPAIGLGMVFGVGHLLAAVHVGGAHGW